VEPPNAPDLQSILAEYQDVGEHMRFHADARFKILTLFLALATGLAAGALQFPSVRELAAGAGIVAALLFYVIERRHSETWQSLRRRAGEIEERLGLGHYRSLPPGRIITSTNATAALYVGAVVFWVTFLGVA
jgi:hypothetical protein